MKFKPLEPSGMVLIELVVHRDTRGFFVERFQFEQFKEHGLPTVFAQDNHTHSLPGVLRGLHFQYKSPQGKLIGVIRGRIWDVAVDLRQTSPTFGKVSQIELSAENGRMLWIPPGFCHGFCVLGTESADVIYKVDSPYNPAGESGIHWADPELAISWPIHDPLVSTRDQQLGSFAEYRQSPVDWEIESHCKEAQRDN